LNEINLINIDVILIDRKVAVASGYVFIPGRSVQVYYGPWPDIAIIILK